MNDNNKRAQMTLKPLTWDSPLLVPQQKVVQILKALGAI